MKIRMAEELIENIDKKKLRGGYYTPQPITDFICKWAITSPAQKVLEPSCGDGNFIESAIMRFKELGVNKKKMQELIKGIELIKEEAEKSQYRAAKYGLNSSLILNTDFFSYVSNLNEEENFDVVVGNPPFIRYQNFPEEHRDIAIRMMKEMGLNPNKLTNIWVPFLVISASRLKNFGKLAMVIPAELFQVKYAAETRVFLSNFFSRITVVTFKKLVFTDIQQEVIILLCEKDVTNNTGIRFLELNNLSELNSVEIQKVQEGEVKSLDHSTEKWTKYFLNEDEIQLLRRLKLDRRLVKCSDIMEVDVGIVTGRNEFFMLRHDIVSERKLKTHTTKVVSKSNHFKGIVYTVDDFKQNSEANYPVHLFLPADKDFVSLPKSCRDYITYGEEMGFHTGYKCSIRKHWYITPSLWYPDAFVLRQVGDYPKLIINKTNASSTDTIHRVRFNTEVEPEIIALSFLNSLTFAFSEILGRSYGGGVLTFEPSEIEEIPLPLLTEHNIDFNHVDELIRKRKIEEVLDIVDNELLIRQLNFTIEEVQMLRAIWRKLALRRNGRNKKTLLQMA